MVEQDALVGRTIAGKFRVEELIGRGGMGRVYRAQQTQLRREVALKVLRVNANGDPAFGARFQREARYAARLDHPHSVRVIDFGEEPGGLFYMVMDYVDGQSLDAVLASDGPFAPERAVRVVAQALAALHVAHEMGIVHRDLKPANIMVSSSVDDDGRANEVTRVCDFGVAKLLASDRPDRTPGGHVRSNNTQLTARGTVIGTPAYMSPEQALGEALDGRSDLYSMGVILFELLTGRLPFEAPTPLKMMLKHVQERPPRPGDLRPGLDPAIEDACLRALEKDSAERFASAREMRATLLAAAGQPTSLHMSVTAPQPPAAAEPPARHASTRAPRPSSAPKVPGLGLSYWGAVLVAMAVASLVTWLVLRR